MCPKIWEYKAPSNKLKKFKPVQGRSRMDARKGILSTAILL